MTTVGDILRERVSTHGRLAGGANGLRNPVSWAVTARARTPALDPLQGGEIVLLSTPALLYLGGKEALPSLMPGFREAGASGLCLWVEPDSRAVRGADEAALPLIHMSGLAPQELERQLLDYIAGQLRQGLTQGHDRQANLLDTLAANQGPDAIIRLLADTTGLCAAYYPVSGTPILSPNAEFSLPHDFWEQLPTQPEVITLSVSGLHRALWVTPVARNRVRLGALVVGPVPGPPAPADKLAMRQTAAALWLELGRQNSHVETQQRAREELYRDIFTGRFPEMIYGRARSLGILLPEESTVAIIAPIETGRSIGAAVKDRLHASLSHGTALPILDTSGEILMLLPPQLRGENARALLGRALIPPGESIAVGLSEPAHQVARVPEAVEEARTALLVSRRIRGGAITRFSETGVYGLLAPLTGSPIGRSILGKTLEPLVSYDEEHNTSLVMTLETYVRCNGNVTATAEELNLHRNSLSYRLRRIEELTGLKLWDAENRLLLALALKLKALMP